MESFVEKILYDNWIGNICHEREMDFPKLSDVYDVIDMLDAKTRTILSLYGRDGSFLTIGGGAGQYVVYASMSDEQLWNLHPIDAKSDRKIILNAGGQEGEYSSHQIVGKETVIQSAASFFFHGTLEPSNQWEKQE
ncbi:hypothetical protein [Mesorhizobium huakuii]|uniref:Uncharacterized protein n=1 Tax=Mesorhizobium huakuii TaxID=28104 RepID=A0ABZ0VM34_9HYPH|nr:hypothetical protein [Mesorhizobium huakuii]WQB97364.1 hypothetical protein U0R22_001488 [Mesorhizobium huakuii]